MGAQPLVGLSLWRGAIPIPPKRRTMPEITAEIAAKHGLTVAQLRGPDQAREIAWARFEAMAVIRAELGHSLPKIGVYFGRHHTTVLAAIRRFESGKARL